MVVSRTGPNGSALTSERGGARLVGDGQRIRELRRVRAARARGGRRDGRSLSSDAPWRRGLRAGAGDQAHPARPRRRRVHAHVHRRGEDRRSSLASECCAGLRPRACGRAALHRPRVRSRPRHAARGRSADGVERTSGLAAGHRHPRGDARRARAARGAHDREPGQCHGHHPPRRLAPERPALLRGSGEGDRLRPGQGRGAPDADAGGRGQRQARLPLV